MLASEVTELLYILTQKVTQSLQVPKWKHKMRLFFHSTDAVTKDILWCVQHLENAENPIVFKLLLSFTDLWYVQPRKMAGASFIWHSLVICIASLTVTIAVCSEIGKILLSAVFSGFMCFHLIKNALFCFLHNWNCLSLCSRSTDVTEHSPSHPKVQQIWSTAFKKRQ